MGLGTRVDDGRWAGHRYYCNRAFIPFESPVHMVRLPRTGLFVLGDTHPKLGWQSDEVRVACSGVTISDVYQTKTESPADSGIRAIDHARPHRRSTKVNPCLLRDGTVHQDYRSFCMSRDLHIAVIHLRLG